MIVFYDAIVDITYADVVGAIGCGGDGVVAVVFSVVYAIVVVVFFFNTIIRFG